MFGRRIEDVIRARVRRSSDYSVRQDGKNRHKSFLAASIGILTATVAVSTVASVQIASAQDEPTLLDRLIIDLVTETEGATEIDQETIARQQATTLDEVLKTQPGIDALLGPGRQFADVNIRGNEGAGAVIVSVDGAEKNQVQTKHGTDFNAVFLNPDFLERATIVKGPVSNVYGTGSVGGSVVLRTVDPDDILSPEDRLATRFKLTGESNGPDGSASVVSAGRPSKKLTLLGGVSYRDFGSYTDGGGLEVLNSGSQITGFLGKAQFDLNDRFNAEPIYNHNQTSYIGSNIFGQANTRQDTDFDNDVLDQSISGNAEFIASDSLTFNASAFWSRTEHTETLLESRRGSRETPGDFDFRDTTSYGVNGYTAYVTDIGSTEHTITAGGSFVDNMLDYSAQAGGSPSETAGDRLSYSFFIQDQINYGDWLEIIPGVRYEAGDPQEPYDFGVIRSG